jgi:predicted nucleic acid-binding Zn ribbon protein
VTATGGGTGSQGGSAAAGADLARQILAQAKRDARERAARARRPGRPFGPGRAAEAAADGGERGGERPEPSATAGSATDGAAGSGPATLDARRRRLPGIAPLGREWRQPVTFAAAVRGLVDERGWRDRAEDAAVLARWEALVGSEIAARCAPVSLRDGELVVVAESTAWATQLRLLSGQILARLRAELGPRVARSVTIRGPSTPTWNHGPLRAPGGRGPRDTYG